MVGWGVIPLRVIGRIGLRFVVRLKFRLKKQDKHRVPFRNQHQQSAAWIEILYRYEKKGRKAGPPV